MKKVYFLLILFCLSCLTWSSIAQSVTKFAYTGAAQTYVVPACVTTLYIDAQGARGGDGGYSSYLMPGGNGGRVQCALSVTPGQVLNIYVGGNGDTKYNNTTTGLVAGGFNGGGTGYGFRNGGGGGATDIRVGGTALSNRVIVAGGGGGAGYNCSSSEQGGAGGGTTGGTGYYCGSANTSYAGSGGGPSSGGAYGSSYFQSTGTGSLGQGGNATSNSYAGGGGGGYYGGGSAGAYAGGGGGSSYAGTGTSSVTHTQGYNGSNAGGFVTIYAVTPTVLSYTGASQTYTVPSGVTSLYIEAIGGSGGNGAYSSYPASIGGPGGRINCKLAVTPGQVLNVYVGGAGNTLFNSCCPGNVTGGFNGGGNGYYGYCGGGGGATDIRVGGTAISNRVIVAGGGGGASFNCTYGQDGGAGGGTVGGNGTACGSYNTSQCGSGGSQSAGGVPGTSYPQASGTGTQTSGGSATNYYYVGGGGGGYWGGGSAGSYAGGGGGSSYAGAGTSEVVHIQGSNTQNRNAQFTSLIGNGQVLITPLVPSASAAPSSITFSPTTTGGTSTSQIFLLSGVDLDGSGMTVTPPANFRVSLDGISWFGTGSPLTVPYSGSSFAQVIYAQFQPTSSIAYSGNITVTGGGMTCTVNVAVSGNGASACSGTPSAGTPTINGSSSASGSSSTAFTLLTTGATVAGGITYQWERSTVSSSTGFSPIPGANTASYVYTGLTANSWFRCVVSCGASTATTSAVSATFVMTSSSCVPNSYTNCTGCGFYVSNGSSYPCIITGASGSISDASVALSGTGGSAYYYNNLSMSATFNPGSTYSCTAGGLTTNSISYSVWIDFNSDGAFTPDELVGGVGGYNNGSARANFPVVIPSTAPPGAYRMRVVMNYDAGYAAGANTAYPRYPQQNPCPSNLSTNVYYADTRDYTAIITAPTPSLTASNVAGFGNVLIGTSSVPVGVTKLAGVGLAPGLGLLNVTAPTNFQVSINETGWSNSITVPYYGGTTSANVYVRYNATSGSSSGNVGISGGGLSGTVNVAVSGTGVASSCSGAPTTGTISASPSSGSAATQFTLSLSGTSAVAGLRFQWQSSPTGSVWTDIPDGIYSTYQFKGLMATTQFRCVVTCGTGASSTSSSVTINYTGSVASSTCTPNSYTNCTGCGFFVSNGSSMPFLMSGANGTSISDASIALSGTGGSPYYYNNVATSITMNPGGTYSATTGGLTGNSCSHSIWIDFNNNGAFTPDELVGGVGGYNISSARATFPVVIPASVNPGSYRMRVVMNYDAGYAPGANTAYPRYPQQNPCPSNLSSNVYYADTRDYTAIIATPQCSGTPNPGILNGAPTASCAAFSTNVFNVGVTSLGGASYQWQSSTSPTSGFTNISGATSSVYVPTLSAPGTVYYRDVVTCVHSGLSAQSIPMALTYNAAPAAITGTTVICNGTTSTLASTTMGGTWSSSASGVASVGTGTGVVTGVSVGTATITYTLPTGCFVTAPVTINPQPAAISGTAIVCGGSGATTVTLTNATSGGSWSSSSTGLATVGAFTGVVTGVAAGNPVITYTLPTGCISTFPMTVNAVAPITGSASICLGFTSSLSDPTPGGTWSSSNTAVATISGAGLVSSVSVGSAVITYSVASIGCSAILPIFVTNPPSIYAVTGGGSFCAGGTGVHVGVNTSDVGITYYLFNGASLVSTAIGTGSSIDFGVFTGAGTYGVVANYGTPCAVAMSGTVTISINPLPTPFTVSGGGAYCAGGSGVHVYLSSSTIGVNYQLMMGSTPIGSPVAGTSSALDFGLVTTPGTYTVVAVSATTSCVNNMSGSVTVSINPLPTAFSVTGGGGFCLGATGVPVGLSGSVAGTTYQLLLSGAPVGSPMSGTGGALSFGIITTGGLYTVLATNTATGCVTSMSGSATVVVNPLPTVFTVTGGGAYCAGGTGSIVGLNGSTAGVNYQLLNGTTPVGSPVAGTGVALSFGPQTTAGSYSVVATNATTGCVNNMFGSVTVSINPLPTSFSVTGGGGYCAGGSGVVVGLSGSTVGVTYQLFNGSTLVGAGSGTGSAISFGLQLAAGVYTVVGTNSSTGCVGNMSGSVTVVINPLPTVFTVTGGGNYCATGTGVVVGLNGSSTGVNYQLYNGSIPMGSAVAGTGAAISFGLQTVAGSYTVVAINSSTTCSINMSGSALVVINPLPTVYTVTGGGGYCAGGTGTNVGLSASNIGISYQLFRAGSPVGTALAGTGTALNFGLFTTAGTYTVVATNPGSACTSNMSGSAIVSINSLPTAYTVTSAGTSYCAGGGGVVVGLNNSTAGVSYQLYNGGVASGSAVAGTGSAISFGPQTSAGTYTVVGTNGTTACTNNMLGSVTISINPLPASFAVTGGGNYCTGGAGVNVGLSGSATGVDYQLMNGMATVGAPMTGTGGTLDFGLQTATGTYTIVATNSVTGCSATMTGSAVVNTTPLPGLYTISGGGNYCAGGTGVAVGLGGSATGISYQLYAGGSPVGLPLPGTGLALNFGLQTMAGTYNVVGTNTTTGCLSLMTGTTTIAINPLPALNTVTGGGNYCVGGTGVVIGLDGSVSGINYQLYNGAVAVGSAVPGSTGSPINFGLQTAMGTYTVRGTNTTTLCSSTMTGSTTIGLHALPTVYNVTGGGNYCSGGTGVNIGLSGSNTGISYQLYNGTAPVGAPAMGSGSAISFGMQGTAGTYTVKATNTTTGCVNNMTGSVTVTISALPAVYTVNGGGNYCAGGTGVVVGLGGSSTGVTYQLYNGMSPVGTPVSGTGGALSFGMQTGAGSYTVVATNISTTCTNTMAGSVMIGIDPLPVAYTVSGGGNYCSGGTGVDITLGGSDPGVTYQLYNGTTAVGPSMTGTGMSMSFGMQTAAGTYTVKGTDMATSCTNNMTGSVIITINPLPTAYVVGGGGNYCAGGNGVHVTLSSSDPGMSYQLMNGTSPVGAPMMGTGSMLDFGLFTATGSYTVVATNVATSCTANMTGSVVVGINPLPLAFSVSSSSSNYCAGGGGVNIQLSSSEVGVTYQLYNGLTPMGSPVAGTGSSIDFGYWLPSGTYTAVATNTATGCSNTMFGSVSITVNPLPIAYNVTGGGSYCNGGTGVAVGLSGSNVGINYQLYIGGTPSGSPLSGTGGPLSFGVQTAGGSYTVVATNPGTTCTNNMTGSVTVAVNTVPATYAVTGGGNFCAGGAGVHVNLNSSSLGVNYQLFRGGSPVGSAVAGTGGSLDFGAQTATGNYTVVATNAMNTCSSTMTGSATVGINAAPVAYAVTGGGNFCPGGSGVHVGISATNTGVTYQLFNGTTAVGGAMSGTGSSLDFGLQTTSGAYTVVATNTTTGCTNNMLGSANVVVNALPAVHTIVGGGSYCNGGSGVHIGLSGSNTGVNYKLYSAFSLVVTLPGTGGPLDFGLQTTAGAYTVIATNASTGCSSNMTGSADVIVNPAVAPFVSISTGVGDTVCSGTFVTFSATAVNGGSTPAYQWTVNGVAAGVSASYSYMPSNGDVVGVTLTSSEACATPTIVNTNMTMVVDPKQTPVVTVSSNPGSVVCQGTNVTYTAIPAFSGTAPTYSWIKNGNPAGSASTYSYVPQNGDIVYCVMTSNYHCRLANTATSTHINMQVDAPVAPTVSIAANPGLSIAAGMAVTFTATVANGSSPSYQWQVNGTSVAGATASTFVTANLVDGDVVTCQVLKGGGCPGLSGSNSVTINVHGVGVQQVSASGSDIKLVPNPNKGIFTVKGTLGVTTDEEVTMEITNMLGQVIYNGKTVARNGELNERIELSGSLANGMYIMSLRSGNDHKVFHIVVEQ